MRMEEGLDTGPVCSREAVAIGARHDGGRAARSLAGRGARLMVPRSPPSSAARSVQCRRHDEGVTYAAKIGKDEGRIDLADPQPAREVHNRVRGLSPVPGPGSRSRAAGKPERVKVAASPSATPWSRSGSGWDRVG